jgi:hypothetical protein
MATMYKVFYYSVRALGLVVLTSTYVSEYDTCETWVQSAKVDHIIRESLIIPFNQENKQATGIGDLSSDGIFQI